MRSNLSVIDPIEIAGYGLTLCSNSEQPVHQQPEAKAMVARLVQVEHEQRIVHRTQLYSKLGKLRYTGYVEQVSCKAERGITSEQLIRLSDCSFIQKGENVLITGLQRAAENLIWLAPWGGKPASKAIKYP